MQSWRSAVSCLTAVALMAAPPARAAGAHEEGLAAGRAANPVVRAGITAPGATAVLPGYTTAPPQRTLFGQPALSGPANAQLSACLATPGDPVCEAILGARISANTPREALSPNAPAVLGARRVAQDPGATLEDIASFYSGCRVTPTATATNETRLCREYSPQATQSCARTLSVAVHRSDSCSPGNWFAESRSGETALAVQCKPDLPATAQRMRITSGGVQLSAFDVNMTSAVVFPQMVATLAQRDGSSAGATGVWIADNRCTGNDCHISGFVAQEFVRLCTGSGSWGDGEGTCTTERPFHERYAACPAGTQSGNNIVYTVDAASDGGAPQLRSLEERLCYAPSADQRDQMGWDATGAVAGENWRAHSSRAVTGYQLNAAYGPVPRFDLAYERPHTVLTQDDQWTDHCPAFESGGRCFAVGAARCVDGPSTKAVAGSDVTRACWRYETALGCTGTSSTDECAPLAAAGCTPTASACRRLNPDTGLCDITERSFTCAVPARGTVDISACPSNVFCVGGSCFNTSHASDADFARSMSFLEAAREAGVYLDTDKLQVFSGEANRCRDRLLKNCCYSDSAGTGMSNQSMFGVGSRLVYDVLMNAGNREFLFQGMQALLMSGGFSGSFTTYGVTVAVNGTALPAGSAVLYSGESVVVAFDPWSLAIAVVIYIVMSMMACDEEEGRLAMKQGAGLCHAVGTYCSSCIRVLGHCVSCITHTTGKCCFNSALARIVNEQGRAQFAKGWGSAQSPDCSGFTVAQLQRLDFSRMDLSEFYASIVPTLPSAGAIQRDITNRSPSCYYGAGRCQ